MDKIKKIVALSFILTGVLGATASVKSATNNIRKLEEVEARLVSCDEFIARRVMETEGTLDDYHRFLELRQKYQGFEKEYEAKQNPLRYEAFTHRQNLASAGMGALLSSSAIVTGLGLSIYEVLRKKREKRILHTSFSFGNLLMFLIIKSANLRVENDLHFQIKIIK